MCEAWAAMAKYKSASFFPHPTVIIFTPLFHDSHNFLYFS